MTQAHVLSPAEISPVELERIVNTALAEDLASGDVTTRTVVPADAVARGDFVAREPMTLAGISVAAYVFHRVDPSVVFQVFHRDGEELIARTTVATVEGSGHAVLTAERVALNLLQRMCGTATRTRSFVSALPEGSHTRIADTRKTTPGLRALERYAVRMGGGRNHRNDLGSAVLIKDNHVAICGGVRAAIERARALCPHTMRIECEVQSLAELDEGLAAGCDVLMLDNFDDSMVSEAMARVRGSSLRPQIEVSGGVSRERIGSLGRMGVDVISIGSLTHGARAMDIGLDLRVTGSWKTS